MRFDVITLFPELFHSFMEYGVSGRALRQKIATLNLWNPRDYTTNHRRTVDDRPYGGGPGMVMKVEPLRNVIQAAKTTVPTSPVVYLSPQGQVLKQAMLRTIAQKYSGIILIAGRYEGVDERLLEYYVDEEWSIGDYVLSGGELPILIIIDAIIRLLPEALGHADSATQDSYSDDLLDCPHYTRPEEIFGLKVPNVLLSGNHATIRQWRLQQALGRTYLRRSDLLVRRGLSENERQMLHNFIDTLPKL